MTSWPLIGLLSKQQLQIHVHTNNARNLEIEAGSKEFVKKNLQYSEAKRGSAAGLEYQPEAAEAAADDLMSW